MTLFPLFLLQGCGGNSLIMTTTTGGEIEFKKKDVSCVNQETWMDGVRQTKCRVNGIRTDITGRVFPFTEEQTCRLHYNDGRDDKEANQDTFACSVGIEFGLF